MLGRALSTALLALCLAAAAGAQTMVGTDDRLPNAGIELFSRTAVLSFGAGPADRLSVSRPEYGLFAQELLAFLAKEVLRDAADEYRYSSIRGPLSPPSPIQASDFEGHCRIVVQDIAGAFAGLFRSEDSLASGDSMLPSLARTTAALFVARDFLRALRSSDDDRPGLFSFEPKIGAGKIGARFAIRW